MAQIFFSATSFQLPRFLRISRHGENIFLNFLVLRKNPKNGEFVVEKFSFRTFQEKP